MCVIRRAGDFCLWNTLAPRKFGKKTYLWLTLTEFPSVDPFPRVVVAPNVNTNKTIIKMAQFNSTKHWCWCKWRQFYDTMEYIFKENEAYMLIMSLCSTGDIFDRRQLSNFCPLPIIKVLAILRKGKFKHIHFHSKNEPHTNKRNRKKVHYK